MLKISFPVLVYTPRYIMGQIRTQDQLCKVSEKKLDSGCFDDAVLIDSSGARFNVLSVNKKKFSELNKLHYIKLFLHSWQTIGGGDKGVWADLILSEPQNFNVDLIRKEIINVFCSNPKWYKLYGETEQSIISYLNEAKTMEQLISSISVYP